MTHQNVTFNIHSTKRFCAILGFSMRAEFANPFIKAAVDVFDKEAGIKLSRRDLKLSSSAAPSLPVAIILGATGAVKGQVVYSMDESFAFELTKKMLPGKLPAELKN